MDHDVDMDMDVDHDHGHSAGAHLTSTKPAGPDPDLYIVIDTNILLDDLSIVKALYNELLDLQSRSLAQRRTGYGDRVVILIPEAVIQGEFIGHGDFGKCCDAATADMQSLVHHNRTGQAQTYFTKRETVSDTTSCGLSHTRVGL